MSELASFSEPRAKARFSASNFCALTLRTAGRLLRLLVKPRSLIETLQYWLERYRTIGLLGWPKAVKGVSQGVSQQFCLLAVLSG